MAHKTSGGNVRLLALLFFLLVPELALLGFFAVGVVLASPAAPQQLADVVVVLGGGDGARYARGRKLVRAGFGLRLVLIEPNPADRQHALANVPNVEIWDDVLPGNTWGEAKITRIRMQANGWRSALVVSDPPHLLRVNYAWFSNFRGSDLSYTLIASNPPWWSAWRW